MSEIPSEFFNKKSFQSLPRLAFLTWLIVFIIDAVILQRFPYSFIRVLYVWIIGMIVSFLFELTRYRNMNALERTDYKKYFMVLNAFIIFLYASSYTGLTKQIGAWGELQETVNQNRTAQIREIPVEKKSSVFLAAIEWAIPVFAKQTSYFPDVTAIAENNELKTENVQLKDSLSQKQINNLSPEVDSLKKENSDLAQQIALLNGNLKNCNDSLTNYINLAGQRLNPDDELRQRISQLIAENQKLQANNTSLQNQNNIYSGNIATLLGRINESNRQVSRLLELRKIQCIARGENAAFRMLNELCPNNPKDVDAYRSIISNLNLINTNLPK
jgi:FtsZ-binding cell division protein ZapB